MINIITIATNGYKFYEENFINTVINFMPNHEKTLYVLTEKCGNDKVFNEKLTIKYVKIFDMIYPTLNINKMMFTKQIIEDFKSEYTFYFDIDSTFLEKENVFWEDFENIIKANKLILTKHPFYMIDGDDRIYFLPNSHTIENFYTPNLTERDNRYASYIEEYEYEYINSALFGGKTEIVLTFCNDINNLIKKDLTRHFYPDHEMSYHIPQYMDENYVNKLANMQMHNEYTNIQFSIDNYSVLNNWTNKSKDTVFIMQKNMDNTKKISRR